MCIVSSLVEILGLAFVNLDPSVEIGFITNPILMFRIFKTQVELKFKETGKQVMNILNIDIWGT